MTVGLTRMWCAGELPRSTIAGHELAVGLAELRCGPLPELKSSPSRRTT